MPSTKITVTSVDDPTMLFYNSLGYSLQSIGDIVGVHPTTISKRLKLHGIPAADTRRTFMEDVLKPLSHQDRQALIAKFQGVPSVKEYVRNLILQDLKKSKTP